MHIVQRSLHEDIEAAVLNKSVFDVWGILRALYESDTDSTIAEKYRVLDHMWYGDKEGEPMHEFLTRWRMAVREFMHVTGLSRRTPTALPCWSAHCRGSGDLH
ncbi:hypothetical protein GN244_ATG01345 [Phytophthora infestans]|uniref:Uncharacterized protein n=1 Tax=Phytophthora infestans TaxID=4787 RepID=A0A833TLW4_PHYIN|nr:hypothetical protein GN244_ATG01345 [Phytophthora infestans]